MDNLIGKYAYKKRGFFSGLIGIIAKNDRKDPITPYLLIIGSGTRIGLWDESEIVLIDKN